MEKYRALRSFAFASKILAWVGLTFGFISFIGRPIGGGIFLRFMEPTTALRHVPMAFLNLFLSIIIFLGLYALAQGIQVVLDIEENTRRCVEHLARKE